MVKDKMNTANYFNKKMNSKNCYVDISSLSEQNYLKGCDELLAANNLKAENLELFFINRFGETIYKKIFKPVSEKYMGLDPSLLSEKVGYFFDLSRLLAFDDNTTRRLTESKVYNAKLGHHIRSKGLKKFYPKVGGMGGIIDLLMEKLSKEGVDVKLSTNIKSINQENGKVVSLIAEEEILTDKLVWTLPSSYLSFLSGLDKKTSAPKFRNTTIYDFTFENPLNSKAAFINIYDLEMLSGRVTLYQNLSQSDNYSCTVEVLADDDIDLRNLADTIQKELVEMGIVKKGNQCTFRQYRPIKNGFPILTTEFVKAQNEISEYCQHYFQNVLFIGRSTGKVFFMSEVLADVFNKVAE
jgi:protoporphyrinogen oxidase